MAETILPFERSIYDLIEAAEKAQTAEERAALLMQSEAERIRVYANLTPWERVQLARHPRRPRMLDYTNRILEDFIELHGDRAIGDDPAMVCGIGRFRGRTIFVAGQQKGVSTEEKVSRNFGMAHPWGYRKAQRIFRLAERLGHPIVTFVDTPAAHPGIEAEQRGQGFAIAESLRLCADLRVPILAVVLSEGGSGGALAIAFADRVCMFQYAVYMICPPERCAEILWRDVEKKELAAAALKVTAQDLMDLGAIDAILPEPPGGAQYDPAGAAEVLADEIDKFLEACRQGVYSVEKRREKFRRIGHWLEEAL